MINIDAVRNITFAEFPAIQVQKKTTHVTITWLAAASSTANVSATITGESGGTVTSLRLSIGDGAIDVVTKVVTRRHTQSDTEKVIYAPHSHVDGNRLVRLQLGSLIPRSKSPQGTSSETFQKRGNYPRS